MKIIIIFILVIIAKIATNTFRYFATKFYYNVFLEYQKHRDTIAVCRYISPISKLFDKAGTQRTVTIHLNHNIYATEISTQLNNDHFSKDIIKIFEITLGIYSQRIRESIYPLYWINLPLIILEKYNFNVPSVLKMPIRIIGWAISVVSAYFLEKFLDSALLAEKIQEFLHILR